MSSDGNLLKDRLKAFNYAFRGFWSLISTEKSIKIQILIAVLMTAIGFFMKISAAEWMFQFVAIGLVLVAESLNTAIERMADFIHPDFHKKIGLIKDIAAGAVFFAAIIAIIIGLIIYVPKFIL